VIVLWDGGGVANDGQPYENSYVWVVKMHDDKVIDGTVAGDSNRGLGGRVVRLRNGSHVE
jgi:hypothetical protein